MADRGLCKSIRVHAVDLAHGDARRLGVYATPDDAPRFASN